MKLQVRFWGTRGSIPSPGPQTVRYGGNTPCLEVRSPDGRLVILDGGTGLRALGQALIAEGRPVDADLFVTHTHWDHVQGFPFFAPLYQPDSCLRVWGWDRSSAGLQDVLREQMSPAVFPVPLEALPARVTFGTIREGELDHDAVRMSAFPVQHPGGALGYKVAAGLDAASLVYISDGELSPHQSYRTPDGWRERLVQWVRGAEVLVHDATYSSSEIESHRGWGHSTCDEAVALALEAGVKQLVLFHHKPERTDDELDRLVASCRELPKVRDGGLNVVGAAEGMTLVV